MKWSMAIKLRFTTKKSQQVNVGPFSLYSSFSFFDVDL
ncbi:hypothetical protein RC62_2204 [Flavobacterium aquidurense]|uniref:Uncharacterized protein n=1 Tax=Flavobacterium aquidurense TaxID=362413 RepID=A0A0Q0WSM8_9FLAO|nr:hypothetical protein RC62_2204 [Flavobacterium aquidurense]